MRNFLLGLPLSLLLAQLTFGDCVDTTLVLNEDNGVKGYAAVAGTYDPNVAGGLNAIIAGCTDSVLTVRILLETNRNPLIAGLKDTVKLQSPIRITGREGKTTIITAVKKPGSTNTLAKDSLITFVSTNENAPLLLDVATGNRAVLNNLGFARKSIASSIHTVTINGKGSKIQSCHFWTLDNSSEGTGALLNIETDSVLVDKSLFRAPQNGNGRSYAIRSAGTGQKLVIRSNVFFSTGLYLTTGSSHIFSNTFAGSRNVQNCIVIGASVTAPETNKHILHNLFVPKADTIPPILYAGASVGNLDNVWRNAWSTSKLPHAFAVDGSGKILTINNGTGSNFNTVLPRGFSNYANTVKVKDFPITQLATDSTLAASHPEFGQMFKVFTSSWTGNPDIKDDATFLALANQWFPNYGPFIPGLSYLQNVRVGAFVSSDTLARPSPIKSGAQGQYLKFQKATDSTRIKLTSADYDDAHYAVKIAPSRLYFFFSDTLSKLQNSIDTAELKIRTGFSPTNATMISTNFTAFDSLLTVPKSIRNGNEIYVKMLHFRTTLQAPVLSDAVIATVRNVPAFPSNDLSVRIDSDTSKFSTGKLEITVTSKSEAGQDPVDSVRLVAFKENGQQFSSTSKAVTANATKFNFETEDQGAFYFAAIPVAQLGSLYKAGKLSAPTATVTLNQVAGNTIYVRSVAGACPSGANGSIAKPYCRIDSALNIINLRKGGTIVIDKLSIPYEDTEIKSKDGGDTSSVTIISSVLLEGLPTTNPGVNDRPVFKGKSKEALTISRKNVTFRGFLIEMPAGTKGRSAISVKAGGASLDANIFRSSSPTDAVEGPAINIDAPNSEMRMTNNVVWGFTKSVRTVNASETGARIVNNTFLGDNQILNAPSTVGITLSTVGLKPVIANNFFSDIAFPLDSTVLGNFPTLDHNVFTHTKSKLPGFTDIGDLDTTVVVRKLDLTGSTYVQTLYGALEDAFSCTTISPCPSLQAANSSADYKVNLNFDITGKARQGKKDVGAFEVNPTAGMVLGRLVVKASKIENAFSKVNFEISTKNYDTTEADSIIVWWSTGVATKLEQSHPASQRKSFPMRALESGSLTGTAEGLAEVTFYNFYACYARKGSPLTLGYPYRDSITTGINVDPSDCSFTASKSTCPSESGYFPSKGLTYDGVFLTRFTLSDSALPGSVIKNPEFEAIPTTKQHNLKLESPLPLITFVVALAGVDANSSTQSFTATIELKSGFNPVLTGKELFLLPSDSSGLPTHVSDWQYIPAPVPSGKSKLIIKSNKFGTLRYAFGTLADGVEPGKISMTNDKPPVFNYATASGADSITLNLDGSGFNTTNPLVLVSAVPAGGMVENIFDGTYPATSLALSANLGNLPSSVQKEQLLKYFLKAAGAESQTAVVEGQRAALSLDSVSPGALESSLKYSDQNLSVSNSRALAPLTVKFPIPAAYRNAPLGRSATRSIEMVFTVFDGSKISRTSAFIRTQFTESNLQAVEGGDKRRFGVKRWNLFGYPWQEADTGSLARVVGAKPTDKWNPVVMRLMKYKGTGTGSGSFTAYNGSNIGDVKFHSGQAIWSGSATTYEPKCASGTSLDYQTFSLTLPANQWTDFSLPFNFPIRVKDIVDSSKISTLPRLYRLETKVNPPEWRKITADSIIFPWDGLTAKPTEAIVLKFPVIDTARSLGKALPKVSAKSENSWTANLKAYNGTAGVNLRIGKASVEETFGEPPSIPGQDFRMTLKQAQSEGKTLDVSEFLQAESGSWQGHWPLHASAASGSGGIYLRVENNEKNIPLYLLESLNQTVTPLKGDSIVLSESELRTNDYHLVAGDAQYIKNILAGILPTNALSLSNYPNPFSTATLIRYALPSSFGKVDFLLKIRDFRGRTVFEKSVSGANTLNFSWDGRDRFRSPLPGGVYTLSLEAKVVGKPAKYKATRRILKL